MLMNANEYLETVEQIKQEIRTAQYRATIQVNCELLRLYRAIGAVINAHKVWGSRFVENLAADIKLSFPEMKGYSVRNLKYMAKFAEAYSGDEFVQQPVAQIPWGHNVVLLDKISGKTERLWYAEQSRKNGWSRNVLVHQIESGLYQRQALAEKVSNFELRLPSPQSELASPPSSIRPVICRLLSEHSKLEISSVGVKAENAHAAKDVDSWAKILPPTPGFEEQCYFHMLAEEGKASVYNPCIRKGLTISFDPKRLDHFTQWKMMGVRDYALGLEPGNCYPSTRDAARRQGILKFLKPGESNSYQFVVTLYEKSAKKRFSSARRR